MPLLRYYVDLRSYPTDERLKLADRLERVAFICYHFPDMIGMYEVFWDIQKPISEFLGIPPNLVSKTLNNNEF